MVGAPTSSAVPVAVQEVRSYHHAALANRVVAKLTSADLAPAVDATMEFLGFAAPEVSGAVGIALHGALGFPESALIIDPANARYALGVVKDLNRLGRMAKGRPGASKEGMEKLGATLGNSVPHFLPSYFEQCGRIFMGIENTVYAGAMFVKARGAENTYGLKVNEDHRRAAFLEFAFAGALPGKALDEYAKDLAKVYPADVAFAHFRSLTLQRCRGGLAPWAQMMDVVKRMAKAANADVDQAQSELLAELLGSPALRFASLTFWKSVRKLAITMAKESPAMKGTLLNLHPSGGFGSWWLEMLSEAGALEALCALNDSAVDPEALPIGGPATWLNKFVWSFGNDADITVLCGLLRDMAPRLRADHEAALATRDSDAPGVSPNAPGATPDAGAVTGPQPVTSIQFHQSWYVNLDVIDYALELGIACDPGAHQYFQYRLDRKHQRPLTFLGAAEHLRPALRLTINNAMCSEQNVIIFATPGLHGLLAEWIAARVDVVAPIEGNGAAGVIDFVDAANELVKWVTPAMLTLVPSATERLAKADASATLARQLQLGMFTEFCWPALEEAVAQLVGDPSAPPSPGTKTKAKNNEPLVSLAESWPHLIVHDGAKALVLDHERVVFTHDLRWAPTSWQKRLTFVDGVLFVGWYSAGHKETCYWSNDPNNVFDDEDVDLGYRYDESLLSYEVPGGGRTFEGKAIQVGDRRCDGLQRMAFDGRNFWVNHNNWVDGVYTTTYIEMDPSNGKRGRTSLPAFAEAEVGAGRSLSSLQMYALPSAIAHSPLGGANADGVTGQVVVKLAASSAQGSIQGGVQVGDSFELVRVDGVRITTTNGITPEGLVLWPGDSLPHVMTTDGRVVDGRAIGGAVDGRGVDEREVDRSTAGGSVATVSDLLATWPTLYGVTIPRTYWNYFSVRDATGSASLRTAEPTQLQALLDVAKQLCARATPTEPFDPLAKHPELVASVGELLPAVTDPVLRAAIGGSAATIAVAALDVAAWLEGTVRAGTAKAATVFTDEYEQTLTKATHGLLHNSGWIHMHTQLQVLTEFFTADPAPVQAELDYNIRRSLAGSGLAADELLRGVPSLLYKLLLPSTSDGERAAMVEYLDAWLASPFTAGGSMRIVTMEFEDDTDPEGSLQLGPDGSRWWFGPSAIERTTSSNHTYKFRALGSSATAEPPAGCSIIEVHTSEPIGSREQVIELLGAIRARGPLPTIGKDEVASFAAITGRSHGESAVILSGFRSQGYGTTPMSKEQREALGVKSTEFKAGYESLAGETLVNRWVATIASVLHCPREMLWDQPAAGFVALFGEVWVHTFGSQSVLSDALLASVDKAIRSSGWCSYKPRDVLTEIDGTNERFSVDYEQHFDADGDLVLSPGAEQFNEGWVVAVMKVAAQLGHDMALGDPWRAKAGRAIRAMQLRVSSPKLIMNWATSYNNHAAFSRVAAELPLLPSTGEKKLFDGGDIVLEERPYTKDDSVWGAYLRMDRYLERSPARVLADSAREPNAASAVLDWLFSDRATVFAEHFQANDVHPGLYEQNPEVSAPMMVARVATELGVDREAAGLYLQILTLAEPTSSNLKLWNGWTTKQLGEASSALISAGLVVEAKRGGSGREVFLPGGWVEMRSPAIGIELWKVPFYALSDEPGKRTSHLGRVLPLDPVPVLFTRAWDRYQSGDKPGFSEVGRGLGERAKKSKKTEKTETTEKTEGTA
jgi:hypothetical protein